MKIRILTTFLLLTSVSLFSQSKRFVSVNVSGLLSTQSSLKPAFGIGYEEQVLKHHGYEFGLSYRSLTVENFMSINNKDWYINVNETYLSLPICYKFYSNIVNFTTGISFDCFLKGKYLTAVPNYEFKTYNIQPNLYVGWIFKIGKEINLNDKFILEPEIQYNPIFDYGYEFYGFTMKLKYKL